MNERPCVHRDWDLNILWDFGTILADISSLSGDVAQVSDVERQPLLWLSGNVEDSSNRTFQDTPDSERDIVRWVQEAEGEGVQHSWGGWPPLHFRIYVLGACVFRLGAWPTCTPCNFGSGSFR